MNDFYFMCLERDNPALTSCQTWTRTKINGTRNRCPTIRRSDNRWQYILKFFKNPDYCTKSFFRAIL